MSSTQHPYAGLLEAGDLRLPFTAEGAPRRIADGQLF